MHTAAIARVRFLFDQALGFQRLQRLRHGALGEAKELRHPQRRIRVAIAARQVIQGADLDRLQVGSQRLLPRPDAHQAGQPLQVIVKGRSAHS
ncbi:hypothetical protein D9M68_847280 [compost metagenome]